MLSIEVAVRGNVAMLYCKGRLIAGESAERFRKTALSLCAGLLLIEVSELETIDAAGVGAWLEIHNKAEHRGGTAIIVNPTVWVREFLRITHVESVLSVLTHPRFGEVSRQKYTELVNISQVA